MPFLRTLLALFLGFALVGCKPSSSTPAKSAAKTTTNATKRVVGNTNLTAFATRPNPKSNAPPGTATAGKANPLPGAKGPAKATPAATNTLARLTQTYHQWQTSRLFYPILGGTLALIAAVFLFFAFKPKPKKSTSVALADLPKPAARPLAKKPRKTGFQACNILQVGAHARHLWRFNSHCELDREQTSLGSESLPGSLIAKDWRSLWQRKVNVAWLPPEHVFLRVAQFPLSDFTETLSMVELQLEKLSPIPVAQIVWSIQTLPHADEQMQTVILLIISRSVVEEFLGQLEGQGYLADRLEMPLLDQLQATRFTESGAWIYPEPGGGRNAALVAWWYQGVLQNLDLISSPPADRAKSLREQLTQMAWAGEMEGWLNAPPQWHLVAEPAAVAEWEPALREGLEQPIEILPAVPSSGLAALTARRVAQAEPAANLLPAEFSSRYQQQFVDRLWMRGLGALVALYVIGVVIYFIAVGFASYRTRIVETQVASLGLQFTNTIMLEQRFEKLKERQDLKFAGLDCWKAVAELLPDLVQLDALNFVDGRKLTLAGTAPKDHTSQLTEFDAAIRKAKARDQILFDPKSDILTYQQLDPATVRWNVTLDLKRTEGQ